MGHDPCKKNLFNVVFLGVVAKRRRCSMLCVSAFVVRSVSLCVVVLLSRHFFSEPHDTRQTAHQTQHQRNVTRRGTERDVERREERGRDRRKRKTNSVLTCTSYRCTCRRHSFCSFTTMVSWVFASRSCFKHFSRFQATPLL